MTQHSCQIDDRGSSLLSYCPTRKSGSQRSHHCEPGSFRTFFISESFQGLSPKVSPKLNTLSPPKSPPRFWASPPTFLESRFTEGMIMMINHCDSSAFCSCAGPRSSPAAEQPGQPWKHIFPASVRGEQIPYGHHFLLPERRCRSYRH